MHTETAVRIRGDANTAFDYASRVERWPDWLPHYRSVRIVDVRRSMRLVEMKARRGPIPVWWWARQVCSPEERRIRYTHVRGVTRGMEVEWTLRLEPSGDLVITVVHDLDLRWPLVGGLVARRIIGPLFVEPIVGRTLRRIKELVERAEPTDEPARAGSS